MHFYYLFIFFKFLSRVNEKSGEAVEFGIEESQGNASVGSGTFGCKASVKGSKESLMKQFEGRLH